MDKENPNYGAERQAELQGYAGDLFELGEEQRRGLIGRIGQWKGVIRVFVHPFFYYSPESIRLKVGHLEDDGQLAAHGANTSDFFVAQNMLNLLKRKKAETPPILLFEEASRLKQSAALIGEFVTQNYSDNHPYFIATEDKFGNPKDHDWESIKKEFLELGIKKVLVAGNMLVIGNKGATGVSKDIFNLAPRSQTEIDQYEKKKQKFIWAYYKCVGAVVTNLREGKNFEVDISNFNFPASRRDIK